MIDGDDAGGPVDQAESQRAPAEGVADDENARRPKPLAQRFEKRDFCERDAAADAQPAVVAIDETERQFGQTKARKMRG
jgi:hypothetical protein